MRTFFIIVIVLAAGYQLFKPKSDLDILMQGDKPFIETDNAGIFDVRPSTRHQQDIRHLTAPGHITVVEIHDPDCESCNLMLADLEKLNDVRPDVAIKLIHMIRNYYAYCGDHYGLDVPAIPFISILDTKGEIITKDVGHENAGSNLFYEWVNAELRRE